MRSIHDFCATISDSASGGHEKPLRAHECFPLPRACRDGLIDVVNYEKNTGETQQHEHPNKAE